MATPTNPATLAAELLQDRSPIARDALAALHLGTFGTCVHSDRARWWLQERGLVTGREVTPQGKAIVREINRLIRSKLARCL